MISYDIVLCTKNREKSLEVSIPSFLNQKYLPEKIIVVDASDEHGKILSLLKELLQGYKGEFTFIESEGNLPLQRNIGLEYVTADIVAFPDDDSVWFPDTIENILKIYELDVDKKIGGVCAAESHLPPQGLVIDGNESYSMTTHHRFMNQIGSLRYRLEDKYIPNPYKLLGASYWKDRELPFAFEENNVVLVEYMTGFRMSFRASDIKKTKFNPDLGSRTGWTGGEDVDGCFRIMKNKLIVGARDAKVFHYKFPAKRTTGYKYGFVFFLNRIYVVCSNTKVGADVRKSLSLYLRYKLLLYLIGAANSRFGRERFLGAYRAYFNLRKMIFLEGLDLREMYLKCWDEFSKYLNDNQK